MSDFGERLKKIRKSKKITQKNLADSIQVAQSTIANYENNTRFPGRDKLKELSENLNVSIDYLLGISDVSWIEHDIREKEDNLQETFKNLIDLFISEKNEEAKELIKDLNEDGIGSIKIIEEVLIPVLRSAWDKYERNQIDISDKNCIIELVGKLFDYISESQPLGKEKIGLNVLFMAAPGQEHMVGLKMASEYFKIRGWKIIFIGKAVPLTNLIYKIKKENIDLLGLYSTNMQSVNNTTYLVEAIKTKLGDRSPKILLGENCENYVSQDFIKKFVDYHLTSFDELSASIGKIEKDILKTR